MGFLWVRLLLAVQDTMFLFYRLNRSLCIRYVLLHCLVLYIVNEAISCCEV